MSESPLVQQISLYVVGVFHSQVDQYFREPPSYTLTMDSCLGPAFELGGPLINEGGFSFSYLFVDKSQHTRGLDALIVPGACDVEKVEVQIT